MEVLCLNMQFVVQKITEKLGGGGAGEGVVKNKFKIMGQSGPLRKIKIWARVGPPKDL